MVRERVDALDWPWLRTQLDTVGHAVTPPLLDTEEADGLAALFDDEQRFRSSVDMARHRFGDGRYRYFAHPLPATIGELRASFYAHLAPIADDWARPTPLILRYGAGDWNALHQDLYGDVSFPFQLVTVLSQPGTDFDGGEFVLVEQRPRAQSRAHVLAPPRGAFVIFPTRERPNRGRNGHHRVGLRHGVSTITRGRRTALGIVFHDAA